MSGPRSTMKVNARHAENFTQATTQIKRPKITLPSGMDMSELNPELLKLVMDVHQEITNAGLKMVAKHPSQVTIETDLPENVKKIDSMNESGVSIYTSEVGSNEAKENIINENDFHHRFFKNDKKQTKENIALKSDHTRQNPCPRLKSMCRIL